MLFSFSNRQNSSYPEGNQAERNVRNDLPVNIATRLHENMPYQAQFNIFRVLTCLLSLGVRCVGMCSVVFVCVCVCVCWCALLCVVVCRCLWLWCVAHNLKLEASKCLKQQRESKKMKQLLKVKGFRHVHPYVHVHQKVNVHENVHVRREREKRTRRERTQHTTYKRLTIIPAVYPRLF